MLTTVLMTWLWVGTPLPTDQDPPAARSESDAAAIEQSLSLLQESEAVWRRQRACLSCHHQFLGAITASVAMERGFAIDEERDAAMRDALSFPSPERQVLGDPGINPQFSHSYVLLAMAAERRPRDAATDGAVHLLGLKQHVSGSWRSESYRPPMESSPFTATALSLRAMQNYGPTTRAAELEARIRRAADWLEQNAPRTTEEHVMRLFGLAWAGRDVRDAAERLRLMQREDGGWSQLPTRGSDAYATGQVLVALHEAADMDLRQPALQRGVDWLRDHRLPDGSWHVTTRRKKAGLDHFETGFPHGEDQFISFAATCWATMAWMLVGAPTATRAWMGAPLAPNAERVAHESSLIEVVVSGSVEDLRARLDGGAAVNESNRAGATPLMAAVADPARTRLLLDRGASVEERSTAMSTAFALAAAHGHPECFQLLRNATNWDDMDRAVALFLAVEHGDPAHIQALLEDGADVNSEGPEGLRPLHVACIQGDAETARLLLQRGADPDVTLPMFDDETPLTIAASIGSTEVVRALIEAGADVDVRDDHGRSALHWAAVIDVGHTDVLTLLIEEVPDLDATDLEGWTPLQLAREHDHREAVRLLGEAGAK